MSGWTSPTHVFLLGFVILVWIAPIFVAQRVGKRKSRAGWAWGLLLGWIGVIIVAVLSDKNTDSARQREVADLEAEIRLAELRKRQAELVADSSKTESRG